MGRVYLSIPDGFGGYIHQHTSSYRAIRKVLEEDAKKSDIEKPLAVVFTTEGNSSSEFLERSLQKIAVNHSISIDQVKVQNDMEAVATLEKLGFNTFEVLPFDNEADILYFEKTIVKLARKKAETILWQIDTSTQFQCDIFMVMPFREHLNPVYLDHVKRVTEELGYSIKRGDDPFSQHDIITEIWSLINNAKLIIADCTDKNPNVFYEMGLAHAIGKPVIPISQKEEDIPFDIRQRRFIKYNYNPRGMKQFEEELKKAIQNILGEA